LSGVKKFGVCRRGDADIIAVIATGRRAAFATAIEEKPAWPVHDQGTGGEAASGGRLVKA
jgi:hypothetical protein